MIATPYPELLTDTRRRDAAIAVYTAAVVKSRREYRLNPFAACGVSHCDRLRRHGRMCGIHAGPNFRKPA